MLEVMIMVFKKKIREEADGSENVVGPSYIDLAKYIVTPARGRSRGNVKSEIKIAEIDGFEDVRALANYVYDGDILIVDFNAIANDELTLRRVASELSRLADDVGGDIAGLGTDYIIITPRGIGISRKKYRKGTY